MLRFIFIITTSLMSYATSVFATDIFTCPKVAINGQRQNAQAIDLFSGPPAELAMLKPDNADTDDKGPQYWQMGPSQYDYWYVCNYSDNQIKREFKLTKNYQSCSNVGVAKTKNKLKCVNN